MLMLMLMLYITTTEYLQAKKRDEHKNEKEIGERKSLKIFF